MNSLYRASVQLMSTAISDTSILFVKQPNIENKIEKCSVPSCMNMV